MHIIGFMVQVIIGIYKEQKVTSKTMIIPKTQAFSRIWTPLSVIPITNEHLIFVFLFLSSVSNAIELHFHDYFGMTVDLSKNQTQKKFFLLIFRF